MLKRVMHEAIHQGSHAKGSFWVVSGQALDRDPKTFRMIQDGRRVPVTGWTAIYTVFICKTLKLET